MDEASRPKPTGLIVAVGAPPSGNGHGSSFQSENERPAKHPHANESEPIHTVPIIDLVKDRYRALPNSRRMADRGRVLPGAFPSRSRLVGYEATARVGRGRGRHGMVDSRLAALIVESHEAAGRLPLRSMTISTTGVM